MTVHHHGEYLHYLYETIDDLLSSPTVPVETDCDVIVYPYLEYLFETDDGGIVCPYPEYLYETDDMLLYVLNLRTCMKLTTMCYDCAASRTAPGLL